MLYLYCLQVSHQVVVVVQGFEVFLSVVSGGEADLGTCLAPVVGPLPDEIET